MLIGASLLVLSVIIIFSLVLGSDFIGGVSTFEIDNVAIVNGTSTTFAIPESSIFFQINTGDLWGAITIITVTLIGMAAITGISVVSTGLNPQSAKIIIIASIYGVTWILLSIIAFPLIASIEGFGYIIYVFISIAFVVGVIQRLSGAS